jgi:hypothetical protein
MALPNRRKNISTKYLGLMITPSWYRLQMQMLYLLFHSGY